MPDSIKWTWGQKEQCEKSKIHVMLLAEKMRLWNTIPINLQIQCSLKQNLYRRLMLPDM